MEDRAAFAAALVARMRDGGVVVAGSGPTGFVQALAALVPRTRSELYWAARLTLVNRMRTSPPLMRCSRRCSAMPLGLEPPGIKASKGCPHVGTRRTRPRRCSAR